MEQRKIRQKDLAEKMGCSPQYISKILKGSENLTLETISKLEDCLDLDLVKSGSPQEWMNYMVKRVLLRTQNIGNDNFTAVGVMVRN